MWKLEAFGVVKTFVHLLDESVFSYCHLTEGSHQKHLPTSAFAWGGYGETEGNKWIGVLQTVWVQELPWNG